MNTPYEIFRNKNKQRKQKINQTLYTQQPTLFIQPPARARTSDNPTSPRKYAADKRIKSVKSEAAKFKQVKGKVDNEENYHVIIKNTLKKSAQIRFTLIKKSSSLEESYVEEKSSGKNLLIKGQHCGRDLIKLNRRKLEDLISKIQGNNFQRVNEKAIPDLVIQKCKDLKQRMDKRQQNSGKNTPKVRNENLKKMQSGFQKSSMVIKWEEMKDSSLNGQNYADKLDTSQFLRCYQFNKKSEEDGVTNNSFVLNNSKITNFIKESKKRKNYHQNTIVDDGKIEEGPETVPLFSSREVFNFTRAGRKTEAAKSYSPQRLKKGCEERRVGRAKINGFNFQHLNGWQSCEDSPEVNLMGGQFIY